MSETEIESLGTALPKEMKRCRELLAAYRDIGPAGAFGALMIQQSLSEAEEATARGDVVRMIAAYKRLGAHE